VILIGTQAQLSAQFSPLEGSLDFGSEYGGSPAATRCQQAAHVTGLLVGGSDQPVERLEIERERRQYARFRYFASRAGGRTLRLDR
jgi:hypothetical protein